MLSILVVSIIGGISNRIRGGTLTDYIRTKPKLKDFLTKIKLYNYKEDVRGELDYVKDFNALVFASCISYGLEIRSDWTGLAAFILLYGSMRLGGSSGWGGYITAMIDKKIDHNRDDVKLFDKWFRGNDESVLSGWAALSLRGVMWATTIHIALAIIEYIGYDVAESFKQIPLLGIAMGSIYLAAIEICERLTFRGNGWQWGEVAFGAYFFGGVFCLI